MAAGRPADPPGLKKNTHTHTPVEGGEKAREDNLSAADRGQTEPARLPRMDGHGADCYAAAVCPTRYRGDELH